MYRYKQKKEKKYFSMKYLKKFNESDQPKPKVTEDMIEDIKDIFFNCFSEEFDDHFYEWWSNDLEELDDDVFYIEISSPLSYSRIDLIVNSVLDVDPFSDFSFTQGLLGKFNRFKKILKDEYGLEFSDNIN